MLSWWHRIALTLVATFLLLSDDFLQQLYTTHNHAQLEASYVASMLALNLAFWCSGRRWFVMPVLFLFAVMQFFQLAHLSYIGQPLTPVDISRLVTEWDEVSSVVDDAMRAHWPVLLVWGLPYGALAGLYWRYLPQTGVRYVGVPMLLVLAALASKPHRALHFDMIHFMPGPTRSSLHNSLNAFSYSLVRMRAGETVLHEQPYVPYQRIAKASANRPDRLWVVLGESLRADHLGLYGYERDTTPNLTRLHREHRLQVFSGQSASVATGSTIPLFINGVSEPGNLPELRRKTVNLFRLAHEAGWHTFWLSAQESKLLSEVGVTWIDTVKTREDAPLSFARQGDRALLDALKELPTRTPSFGVIHTRAAHIPYEEAYARDSSFKPVWPAHGDISDAQRRVNQYDNALRYTDQLVAELLKYAEQLPGTTWVVITADHGQLLGEQDSWGHNRLKPEVADVPMVIHVNRGRWPDLPRTPVMTHYVLHGWLARQLGWQVINPNQCDCQSWLQGNDLYGDNLLVEIRDTGPASCWAPVSTLSRLKPASCAAGACKALPHSSCIPHRLH